MKFTADPMERRAIFLRRIKGLKKKAQELGTLGGIVTLLLCFDSHGNLETWPESQLDVSRIIDRYYSFGEDERKHHAQDIFQLYDFMSHQAKSTWTEKKRPSWDDAWLNSLPEESLRELIGYLDSKMEMVGERMESISLQPPNTDVVCSPMNHAYLSNYHHGFLGWAPDYNQNYANFGAINVQMPPTQAAYPLYLLPQIQNAPLQPSQARGLVELSADSLDFNGEQPNYLEFPAE